MKATKCDECGASSNDDRGWSHMEYYGDNGYGGPLTYRHDFCPICTDAIYQVVAVAEPARWARRHRGEEVGT